MIEISSTQRFLVSLCLVSLLTSCIGSKFQANSNSRERRSLEPTNDWFTLAPDIDEFQVEMPGLTIGITSTHPNTYIYQEGESKYSLVAFVLTNEDKRLSVGAKLEKTGRDFSERMLENSRAERTKLVVRNLSLNGFPGLEYELPKNGSMQVVRLYQTTERLYSLSAIAPVSKRSSIERFMNSFSLQREKPLQFVAAPRENDVRYGDPKR